MESRMISRVFSLASRILSTSILFGLSACATVGAPSVGSTFASCEGCPEMVVVPAGSFTMGSTKEETDREKSYPMNAGWEKPQHQVAIPKPFALGRDLVTKAQYARFVSESGHYAGVGCYIYLPETNEFKDGPRKSFRDPNFEQGPNEPVVCVNWNDATEYVKWLGRITGKPYRLPSEAELEYAARAGTNTVRPWGDSHDGICKYVNVADKTRLAAIPRFVSNWNKGQWADCEDGFVYTSPVGAFPANAFGLHDTLGNVWAVSEDCFHQTYAGAPSDGSAWIAGGDCDWRMIKGGSFSGHIADVRPAQRGRDPVDYRANYIGFRIAMDIP